MYSLYIPKYESDPSSALLLPKELSRFMAVTNYAYDLLVSPGFLSRTDKTIGQFLAETEATLTASGKRQVGLGLFHGMNGYNRVVKGHPPTLLDAHDATLAKSGGLVKISVNPQKRDDHRKMIFFFERGNWLITDTLNQKNMEDFLREIKVKAILIGSSNFSWSTYYNSGATTPQKGEADLLMFVDGNYREEIKREIDDSNLTEYPMALFEKFICRKDPEKFMEDILRDFLTHSLN